MQTRTMLTIVGVVFVLTGLVFVLEHHMQLLPQESYNGPIAHTPDTGAVTSTSTSVPASEGPTLEIENVSLPDIVVSYHNLPLANVRLKNSSGRYVDHSMAGSEGSGTARLIIPAVELAADTYTAEAVTAGGVVVAKSDPLFITPHTENAYLGFSGVNFPPITGMSREVTQGLCGVVFGDTCYWGDLAVSQKPFYVYGTAANQPLLDVVSPLPNEVVTMGKPYVLRFTNDGIPDGRYRVYAVHRNLIGEINEVHELHITNESKNITTNLTLDLNEEYLDAHNGITVAPLDKGHYELVVADVDTGQEGGAAGWVDIEPAGYTPLTNGFLLPYAKNTPLVNSYWDGRGVFYNGNAGEDTLAMTGDRKNFAIWKGIDMPSQNQYDVVVFFRRLDNVVIVTTNVEIIKFDDQTIRTTDLIQQLPQL